MRTYRRLFFVLVLFLAGCAPHQKHVLKGKATAFIHPLPAVFRADLALKRCPPTSFELVLRPDGLYFLQMQKGIPGNAPVQAEIGVWRYNEEKKIVRLTSYDKAVRTLTVTGKQVLKLTKASGGIMPPLVRYDFILAHTKPTYEGVVRVQGMYSRKRGRGVFRECLSGVSFPLLSKGRAAAAEQAYQDIMHGRSESLFVTLDVRFSSQAGRGDRLVPVRSVHFDPYYSCKGEERRIATIADNRWYLIEVGGKTLELEPVGKSPFLKVQRGEQLIQGFAGCNNFTGSWLFADNDFVFSRIAETRMACPVGMEVEGAFLQALDNTRRYTIRGDILRLHDRQGKVLARLRHSRQLTDLDFTLSPEQEEPKKDNLSDVIGVPRNHSVEVEGGGADAVTVPVIEASEKKNRSKASNSGNGNTNGRKITVLKAKRKVAVRTTAPTDILPGVAKEATPAQKTSVPIAVNERQEGKTEVPSAPEKSTEQEVEKKAPVDKTEQSISSPQQSNQVEEVTPSKKASVLTLQDRQEVQAEQPESAGNESVTTPEFEAGENLPAGEAVAQPAIQSNEEKEVAPTTLPTMPEAGNGGQGTQPESATTGNENKVVLPGAKGHIAKDDTVQIEIESREEKEARPSLSLSTEVENDGQKNQSVSPAVEEGNAVLLPEPENKTPANEMVQPDPPSDAVEKINPSTTPSPERENNEGL